LHEGEASCLAFSKLCSSESLIVLDERTTRVLFEGPERIKELIEKKIHAPLTFDSELFNTLGTYKFIRSTELLFIAYKKDLLGLGKSKEVLDALS
jgi:hypothetical protein